MALPLLALLGLAGGSALAGGLASATRNKGGFQQVPRLAPNQLQGQNQALQMALSGLQNPTQGFAPIEQQEVKRFNEQTVPGLAERFTAMGGGQRSSAFQGALGDAGADLGGQLAAQKAQYGLQSQGLLQQLLGLGMQPQFDNAYQQPSENFASGAFGGLSSGLGALAGVHGMGLGQGSSAGLLGGMLPQQGSAQAVASLQSPKPVGQAQRFNGQANFEDYLRQLLTGYKG